MTFTYYLIILTYLPQNNHQNSNKTRVPPKFTLAFDTLFKDNFKITYFFTQANQGRNFNSHNITITSYTPFKQKSRKNNELDLSALGTDRHSSNQEDLKSHPPLTSPLEAECPRVLAHPQGTAPQSPFLLLCLKLKKKTWQATRFHP